MACATLKRSLDWENLNQRPTKRRRCNWLESKTSATSPTTPNRLRNETKTIQNSPTSSRSSIFADAQISKISPEKMANDIRDEIKRLHKRKQLQFSNAVERMQDTESSGSEMGNSPRRPESPQFMGNPEKALFTFKQVQLICERMLKEREDEIREKYDAVLNNKLVEQYDAFVKFTYDQIQKRYEAAPSYLS